MPFSLKTFIPGLVMFFVCLLGGCSENAQEPETVEMPNIVFESGQENGEVVFDDKAFGEQPEEAKAFDPARENTVQISSDGSQIKTTFDGQGNKIEKRCFPNHPTLKCLMITSSADGRKEGVIYGQSGRTKALPPEMIARALTDSGNTIAQAAGIRETRKERQEAMPDLATGSQSSPTSIPPPAAVAPPAPEAAPADNNNPAEIDKKNPEQKTGAPDGQQSQALLLRQVNQANFKRKSKNTNERDKSLD